MSHRILLADDNEELRRSITHVLEKAGYLVVGVASGNEALQLLNSATVFDLLVTDLVMADMEGFELIARTRKSQPKLGIVAMSGAGDGRFLSAVKYLRVKELEKPFTRAELLAAVKSALPPKASSALV